MNFGFAAAALALQACGETGSEPATPSPSAGGVTIDLPEAKAPPVPASVPEPKTAELEPIALEKEKATAPVADAPPVQPEPSKAEPPPPERAPASDAEPGIAGGSPFPLPGAVVARTIEGIGFSCGAVASSVRVEAPAGERAYRITCTSGDAYRASDKSGRFRFRKWDGDV
jgi:hypothetical protein